MMITKQVNISCFRTQIINMVGQSVNIFLTINLIVKSKRNYINPISENSLDVYMSDVHAYPVELHEFHDDYPLAPEKLEISHDILSKYSSYIASKYDIKIGGVNKLVPNLGYESKYIFHYKNLQLYLSLGIKLTNIHKILKLKQSG